MLIIGGGATGAGIAVDAAARGFSTVLFDTQDFSEGTSSRSSQTDPRRRSLYEESPRLEAGSRGDDRTQTTAGQCTAYRSSGTVHSSLLRKLRARILHGRSLPLRRQAYGGYEVGKTEFLSAAETIRRLPGVKADGLKGGVQFWDAQFDDSRLNIALMKTAEARGALLLNYVPVVGFERGCGGEITVVKVKDKFSGKEYSVKTRMVFNAAGVWADENSPHGFSGREAVYPRFQRLSYCCEYGSFRRQDRHVYSEDFRRTRSFCIPWHGVLEIGTTDKEEKDISFNPEPTEEEIEFMLETACKYLAYPLSRKDVLASFAGLRPLFNPNAGGSTAAVSREHSVIPEFKNMITVTGGKWTAYRKMAEHAMSVAVDQGLIYKRPCPTKYMSIYRDNEFNPDELEAEILKGTLTDEQLKAYAVHCRDTQFAMTPEDVLYRRLRIGQMNKAKTEELLPKIKDVLKPKLPDEKFGRANDCSAKLQKSFIKLVSS